MDTTIDQAHAHLWSPLAALGKVSVDTSRVREIDLPPLLQRGERSYSAEIWACQLDEQSRLVEGLIGFALDMPGAHHLEVRVRPAER